jgi:hypothetical protein
MMKKGFEIKLKPRIKKPTYSLDEVATETWYKIKNLLNDYIMYYVDLNANFSDIFNYLDECSADLFATNNSINFVFTSSEGADLSYHISYHWFMLIFSKNQESFNSFFKSMDWELTEKFTTLEQIKKEEEHIYFEYEDQFYGLFNFNEKPSLLYDDGEKKHFSKFPKSIKEEMVKKLKEKKCVCPFCTMIENKEFHSINVPKHEY